MQISAIYPNISPRNYLLNGGGRFAQRGTQLGASPTANVSSGSAAISNLSSITGLRPGMRISNANFAAGTTILSIDSATTATASANSSGTATGTTLICGLTDGQYHADRWYALWQTENVRYDRSTGDADSYAVKLTQHYGTAQRCGLAQVIEQADSLQLRSKPVRAQARVKISASSQTVRIAILEWTGTADAPTKDVVLSWTSGTFTAGNFFLASNLTVVATSSVAPSAATWTDLAVTGTISSSANNLYVMTWTDGTQAQNVTLEVSETGLYEGQTARDWHPPQFAEELSICQRYYHKTFAQSVDPVVASGESAGCFRGIANGTGAGAFLGQWRFATTMRVKFPTFLTFNPINYATGWWNTGSGANVAGAITDNGDSGCTAYNTGAVVDLNNYIIHCTADAELGA